MRERKGFRLLGRERAILRRGINRKRQNRPLIDGQEADLQRGLVRFAGLLAAAAAQLFGDTGLPHALGETLHIARGIHGQRFQDRGDGHS
jgi:hypothetical protein